MSSNLSQYLTFKNGRTSPKRHSSGKHLVYGSNGIIGESDEANSEDETIVIGRVGTYCGSVHFSKRSCWVTDNAIICKSKDVSEVKFWYYLLINKRLNNLRAGSGQPLLNQRILNSIEVYAPGKKQRKLIGHILSTIDDKIELNQRMNKTLEEMAQSTFKCWFVDFEPTRAKMAGESEESICNRLKITPEILDLFPDKLVESELGLIPEGWEVKGIDEITTLDTTSVKPFNEPDKVWKHYSIPSFDIGQSPVYDLGSDIKSNKYQVQQNAVLVSKLNPATKRIWFMPSANEDAICSTEFMQFVPNSNPYDQSFIYSLVLTVYFQREILSRVTGSTGSRQRAMPQQVHKIPVILPSKKLGEEYSRISKPLIRKTIFNIEENGRLSTLRDTLLPKLLSGELSVDRLEVEHA